MNKLTTPLVSVITPVFNLENFIEETLDSISSQTYENIEIIIIDDNSTDRTYEIVREYQKKDPRVILLRNGKNSGVSGNRNTGIEAARGEWIAFLDGDDIWPADSLMARLSCLEKYPDAMFISGDYANFYKSTHELEPSRVNSNVHWGEVFSRSLKISEIIALENPITLFLRSVLVWTGTVLVDAQLIKRIGGFDEKITSSEDDHMWLRIANNVDKLVFTPKVVAFYRQRAGSLTNMGKSVHHNAPEMYKSLLENPSFLEYRDELICNIRTAIVQNCYFYRKNSNFLEAFKWSLEGVWWEPMSTVSWKNFFACCLLR